MSRQPYCEFDVTEAPAPRPRSKLSKASLPLAIVSFCLWLFSYPLALAGALAATALAIAGLTNASRRNLRGHVMAATAMILSLAGFALLHPAIEKVRDGANGIKAA